MTNMPNPAALAQRHAQGKSYDNVIVAILVHYNTASLGQLTLAMPRLLEELFIEAHVWHHVHAQHEPLVVDDLGHTCRVPVSQPAHHASLVCLASMIIAYSLSIAYLSYNRCMAAAWLLHSNCMHAMLSAATAILSMKCL